MQGVLIYRCASCIPSAAGWHEQGSAPREAGGSNPKHPESCFFLYTYIVPLTAWIYCQPIPACMLRFKSLLIFSSLCFQTGVNKAVRWYQQFALGALGCQHNVLCSGVNDFGGRDMGLFPLVLIITYIAIAPAGSHSAGYCSNTEEEAIPLPDQGPNSDFVSSVTG